MLDSERLKIVNNRGETYLLHPNYAEFGVLAIEGLSLPDTTVNISESGTTDGGKFNSAHIGVRDIVIHLVMFGWTEAERKKLYRMFPAKSAVDLYYRNTQYNVKTTGYVKHIDPVPYYDKTRVRVELTCPDPYLHDVDSITAETSGTTPTVTIKNVADTDIGFTAEITISTEDEPSLNYTTTQSATAEYLGSHTYTEIPTAGGEYFLDAVDLQAETFNIFINDEIKTEDDGYSMELLTMTSGHKMLYLVSENGGLANQKIKYERIVDATQVVTDMRCFESENVVKQLNNGECEITKDVPSWYDFDKNKVEFIDTDLTISVAESIKDRNPDGTYRVTFNLRDVNYDGHTVNYVNGILRIFGSVSGVNVKTDSITRPYSASGYWLIPACAARIINPTLPAYDDTKDILRVYMGDRIKSPTIDDLTKSDGTVIQGFYFGESGITNTVTFEVISSQDSTDIRDYTQEQIDTAMCLVDGLTITNTVSGEYMAFPNYQFKNGDVLSVSTVAGSIDAKVSNSDTDKSLIAEVINNGSFFKLKPGTNVIQITADTNNDYASGVFGAEMLYGGV